MLLHFLTSMYVLLHGGVTSKLHSLLLLPILPRSTEDHGLFLAVVKTGKNGIVMVINIVQMHSCYDFRIIPTSRRGIGN